MISYHIISPGCLHRLIASYHVTWQTFQHLFHLYGTNTHPAPVTLLDDAQAAVVLESANTIPELQAALQQVAGSTGIEEEVANAQTRLTAMAEVIV